MISVGYYCVGAGYYIRVREANGLRDFSIGSLVEGVASAKMLSRVVKEHQAKQVHHREQQGKGHAGL